MPLCRKRPRSRKKPLIHARDLDYIGKRTFLGNYSLTEEEFSKLKKQADHGYMMDVENRRLKEELSTAKKEAVRWSNKYHDLWYEVKPYLDALHRAPELVRGFLEKILAPNKDSPQKARRRPPGGGGGYGTLVFGDSHLKKKENSNKPAPRRRNNHPFAAPFLPPFFFFHREGGAGGKEGRGGGRGRTPTPPPLQKQKEPPPPRERPALYRCISPRCVQLGTPLIFFALNLLTHGSRLHFSNIPLGHRSESNRHSSAGHCR